MNIKQIQSVIKYLVEASKNKQLKWDQTLNDDFRLIFPKSTVVSGSAERGAYLSFFNEQGMMILNVSDLNAKTFGVTYEDLDLIYKQAENQVFRLDETFDDILANIPKPEPSK